MRKLVVAITTVLLAAAGVLAVSQAAGATACEAYGSLPRTGGSMNGSPITAVRSGQHPCFDRLVIDLQGPVAGYDVRYVTQVTEDGSGFPVPLRGDGDIQVVVKAPAYDISTGQPTYSPANKRELVNVSGYRTFRQVAFAGSFEGQTTFGLGVRARLPFKVSTLTRSATSSSVIIDVFHRWEA